MQTTSSPTVTLMYNKMPVASLTIDFNLIKVYNYEKYNAIIDIEDFILDRIPSPNRRDIEQLLFKWGINEYNSHEIALKTRLINPMDKYWLKVTEEDDLTKLTKQLFHDTKIIYSPSGNNIKTYAWYDNKFGINKKRLSPVITDTESEVICYRLANLLGVSCCPATQIDQDWSFSEYLYDFNKETFKHIRQDMPNYSGDLFSDLIETYPDLTPDIYRMVLFDFITRQDDRHRSNIAVLYTDGERHLYPLYDNGRSLFFEDTESFINQAISNIQLYATSFGEVGTYYDCVKLIPNPQQYINLQVSKTDIQSCFEGLDLPDYKVTGCIKWILSCLEILKDLSNPTTNVTRF